VYNRRKEQVQCVSLGTEPGISLIILTPMKILRRNLNTNTFVVWEMKRNVSVVRFRFLCNILISGKIILKMPGSVASGTHCMINSIAPSGKVGSAQIRPNAMTRNSGLIKICPGQHSLSPLCGFHILKAPNKVVRWGWAQLVFESKV